MAYTDRRKLANLMPWPVKSHLPQNSVYSSLWAIFSQSCKIMWPCVCQLWRVSCLNILSPSDLDVWSFGLKIAWLVTVSMRTVCINFELSASFRFWVASAHTRRTDGVPCVMRPSIVGGPHIIDTVYFTTSPSFCLQIRSVTPGLKFTCSTNAFF